MRTDQQIVDDTNELAAYLLRAMFNREEPEGWRFYREQDPRSIAVWHHAVQIMEMTTQTEVADALAAVLAEEEEAARQPTGLRRIESFLSGFEDDPRQEGIGDMLADVRAAIEANDVMLAALKRIVAGREIRDPSDSSGSTIIVSLDQEEIEAICTEAIAKVEGR